MDDIELLHPNVSVSDLEAAARERWGDAWSLQLTRFADGTGEAIVRHKRGVVGRTSDGRTVVEHERLLPGDDAIHHETVRVTKRERVDDSEITPLEAADQ